MNENAQAISMFQDQATRRGRSFLLLVTLVAIVVAIFCSSFLPP
jgi:CHASE3 domain sensor protein